MHKNANTIRTLFMVSLMLVAGKNALAQADVECPADIFGYCELPENDGFVCTDTSESPCSKANTGDTCSEAGVKVQRVYELECSRGRVYSFLISSEEVSCPFDTDGNICEACSTGSCRYSHDCDESGSKTKTCYAYSQCSNGTCQLAGPATSSTTLNCSRNTDRKYCKHRIHWDGMCWNEYCYCDDDVCP